MLNVQPITRKFIPENVQINTWDDLQPFAKDLETREINTLADYQRFLEDQDEFGRILSEDFAWRYIKMTCNTADKKIEEAYHYAIEHIGPKASELDDVINRKMAESPFAKEVKDIGFSLALKGIQSAIELFRPENIPLYTQAEQLSAEAVKLKGAMTVTLDGEEMTLQKAGDRLFWTDRAKREESWKATSGRRYQDVEKLDEVFAGLVKTRTQIAANAGFDNYRDYAFKSLKRYDYTAEDCLVFHDAIEKAVMPLVLEMQKDQAKGLGLEKLRPWDGAVDPQGRPPLKAFKSEADLVEKSLKLFKDLDPIFHDTVQLMKERNQLDLGSRLNKAPGGYMYPLYASKVPFIFANATEKVDDLVTLIHEVGHAVHEILKRDLTLSMYGSYPSEVAELASMSMELLTMDQWDIFFEDPEECKRAKRDHLEKIIGFFPWMAQVDAFQHEVYLKPDLNTQDRHKIWSWIQTRFTTGMVDWTGFADWHETLWHRQGHIFENPFYYIEYGIAQLGALQVWRNFKQDKQKALEQYKAALALGYTKSIPEIYETAGIKFDFSAEMLKELMAFVQEELNKLN
jgi:oligoendopeptidase F